MKEFGHLPLTALDLSSTDVSFAGIAHLNSTIESIFVNNCPMLINRGPSEASGYLQKFIPLSQLSLTGSILNPDERYEALTHLGRTLPHISKENLRG